MRISTSNVTRLMSSTMGDSYSNYMNVIKKIANNKNFTKLSENPQDGAKVLKYKDKLAQLNEYQSNIKNAVSELSLAYDTLGAVEEEISNIKSLALQGATGSTDKDSASALADEIEQRVQTVKDKMNTKYLDDYIFSGTFTEQIPYKEDTEGNIQYLGSSKLAGERKVSISPDSVVSYNFTGEEILNSKDGDFFSQMKELVSLLRCEKMEDDGTGNMVLVEGQNLEYDKIRQKTGILDDVLKNVAKVQGEASAKVTKLSNLQDSNESTILSFEEKRSDLEDVDIITAASELAAAQNSLQASYLMSSQILNSVSLLDYI